VPTHPNHPGPVQDPTLFETGVPIQMDMSDDALVTFGAPAVGGVPFQDTGYMPVNALTIAGNPQHLPGGGLGPMFIHYSGEGVQHNGKIDYTQLNYELISYKGQATFGHAADGTPTASGPGAVSDPLHQILLARGDLIQGHLAFGPDGGISGELDLHVQVNNQLVGELDISVKHGAGDIGPAQNGLGLTLIGGTIHATFVPLPAA
jgi:hypothetical protein